MYVYEYLSLQRKLDAIKKVYFAQKFLMRDHLKTADDMSIISIKIKNLHLISNN